MTASRLNCTPTTPTLSLAVAEIVVAVPETVAPLDGAVSETLGDVVSRTVAVNVPLELLPDASLAVHVSIVVPIGKIVPEARLHASVTAGSAASDAVAMKVTIVPAAVVAPTV